jgi:putative N6-adenine-specific DNA methylase
VLECFAACAPGLEPLLAQELQSLKVAHQHAERGGVSFRATARGLYASNAWLRTASRILVRIGRFRATNFADLVRSAESIAWPTVIAPDARVVLRVSSSRSRLYHTGAIAERLAPLAGGTDDPAAPEQLVVVRVLRDDVTISIDSSGEHLHRRGWRLATAKAPLRETLAAAMVLASGWDRTSPFVDPFCGSGTIAIEAVSLARGRAPGRLRSFAFQRWPSYEPGTWASVAADIRRADDRRGENAGAHVVAADRDAGAVEAARANAARAGVAEAIDFRRAALRETAAGLTTAGWIVTNPPYGVRVRGGDLRDLYAALGDLARGPLRGWHVGLLVGDRALAGHTRLALADRFVTTNGGIPVTFAIAPPLGAVGRG